MQNLFFQHEKKETVAQYLSSDIINNKEYHLILVSCYFILDSAEELINELLNRQIKISKISIYIDRGAAIKAGKEKINKWIKNFPKSINVSFKVSNISSLFHAKAYCLLADDSTYGRLVIGSANLTGAGLTEANNGNVELLYNIQDIEDIKHFYNDLTSTPLGNFIDISELENFYKDDYYFKYALVQ